MTLALEWAAKGLYTTSPNPRIGCVIVRDGRVIGAGVTQPAACAAVSGATTPSILPLPKD
eukprot:gene259-354_t